MIALIEIFSLAVNKPITTSHNGKIAAIIAPSPAEINFTPQVVRPLLITKFKKLNIRIGIHSFPFGSFAPLIKKKIT